MKSSIDRAGEPAWPCPQEQIVLCWQRWEGEALWARRCLPCWMWLWSLGRSWLLVSSLVAQCFPRQGCRSEPKLGKGFWTFDKWYQLPPALTLPGPYRPSCYGVSAGPCLLLCFPEGSAAEETLPGPAKQPQLTREPAWGKTRPLSLEHIHLPLGALGQHPEAGKDSQPLSRGVKELAAPRSHGWADLGWSKDPCTVGCKSQSIIVSLRFMI